MDLKWSYDVDLEIKCRKSELFMAISSPKMTLPKPKMNEFYSTKFVPKGKFAVRVAIFFLCVCQLQLQLQHHFPDKNFFVTFRYRNGQLLDLTDKTRFEGATVDQPSLVIKRASREDNGRYSCVLENSIGASESKSAAILTVLCKFF